MDFQKYLVLPAALVLAAGAVMPAFANRDAAIASMGTTTSHQLTPESTGSSRNRPDMYAARYDLRRAKNLARQAIERENGGLGKYHAERSMHGPISEAPYVVNSDGSWTFTFFGGPPGWQASGKAATVESEVTVSPSGDVTIHYNGSVRRSRTTDSLRQTSERTETRNRRTSVSSDTIIDLGRAKNLARQTIEKSNGGLGNYHAERSMHGSPSKAPYVTNADGSWTFTFFGGRPGWEGYREQPTVESEITVTSSGEITIDYNGPVRR